MRLIFLGMLGGEVSHGGREGLEERAEEVQGACVALYHDHSPLYCDRIILTS